MQQSELVEYVDIKQGKNKTKTRVELGSVQCPGRHIIGHFGHDLAAYLLIGAKHPKKEQHKNLNNNAEN